MREIKNRAKLAREDLIISLLRSEISALENNNNTDDDDNNTYDGKIRGDTKIISNGLGNIVTNKYRKKITKELYETEKKAKPFR